MGTGVNLSFCHAVKIISPQTLPSVPRGIDSSLAKGPGMEASARCPRRVCAFHTRKHAARHFLRRPEAPGARRGRLGLLWRLSTLQAHPASAVIKTGAGEESALEVRVCRHGGSWL